MFGDAAAPETAIAVARLRSCSTDSICVVAAYFVASLPMKLRLNMKKSAFRAR
jgi:hypothetical protein